MTPDDRCCALTWPSQRGSIAVRISATFLGLALAGASHADTNHELWPELDIWATLTDSLQLLFIYAGTRDRNGDRTSGDGEGYLDYRMNAQISLRAGFDYIKNLSPGSGTTSSIEHRYVFDFNYGWKLSESGQLTDRSRLDVRDIEGDTSYRFRNRLKYQQEIRLSRATFTPYASIEAYYDTRFSAVSRYRVESGATVPFAHRFEGDFYLGWQRDTQPRNAKVAGLGVTLNCRF